VCFISLREGFTQGPQRDVVVAKSGVGHPQRHSQNSLCFVKRRSLFCRSLAKFLFFAPNSEPKLAGSYDIFELRFLCPLIRNGIIRTGSELHRQEANSKLQAAR
jgi:hypothetical protein